MTLIDIHKSTELSNCLSNCYFLYENNLRLFQDSGPIGLSLLVLLSECYFQKIGCRAIIETLNHKIAPKTFRRFVDDSHVHFQKSSHADHFWEIHNKQDTAIKYTAEFEDRKHSLNFLDISITINTTNKKIRIQSTSKGRNHKHKH